MAGDYGGWVLFSSEGKTWEHKVAWKGSSDGQDVRRAAFQTLRALGGHGVAFQTPRLLAMVIMTLRMDMKGTRGDDRG